jgi:CDP-glucose 4,6-dehydratase
MENLGMINMVEIYKNKRVFLTGHTGFKGSWLSYVLCNAGAKVKGYALKPDTEPALYSQIEPHINIDSVIADINDAQKVEEEILDFAPDFIFHLAAQPLVKKSYKEPLYTFSTNIIGTANVLNALLKLPTPCTSLFITTDKVYENQEQDYAYKETDRLGGHDPYSASKAGAELVISSYCHSFFNTADFPQHQKAIASVRAGNVIGGGDWSEDRLIPDIARSIASNKAVIIRNPEAVRPWQHVLEPVFGYLQLAHALANNVNKYSGAWNFGPVNADNLPVLDIAQLAIAAWQKGEIILQVDPNAVHEANLLHLDISKAMYELQWKPSMNTQQAIERTIAWYKTYYEEKATAESLMEMDILYYQSLLNK